MTRSITFTPVRREGVHHRVQVRAGVEGSRALLGELVMTEEDLALLDQAIAAPPPADVEGKLRALIAAERALGKAFGPSIHHPTPEVLAFALARAEGFTAYSDCGLRSDRGFVGFLFEGLWITVHDVPAPGAESAPLPECGACGSTACPERCPCGGATSIDPLPASDDAEEMPF